MAIVMGMDGKVYYSTTGIGGAPAWNELTNVTDVTLKLDKDDADVTTRANNGWKATVGTLKDAEVSFEMVWDTADAGFTAIKDAWLNDTIIGIQVMDGDNTVSGSQGLEADCMVTGFERSEPLAEAIKVSVTLKPTYSTNATNWKAVP